MHRFLVFYSLGAGLYLFGPRARIHARRKASMPLSTVARLDVGGKGESVTIKQALKLNPDSRRQLVCPQPVCGNRLVPHRESKDGKQRAHFEHMPHNPKCPNAMHTGAFKGR